MKKSLYNTYLSLEDGSYLLYNSFSDKFVAVPASLLQGHNPAEMTPAEVREFSPELYARLEEAGMLVPDELDETAALQERIDAIDNNPAVFHLQLNPTVDCNFRCWYCYEDHKAGSFMGADVMARIYRLVDRVLERDGLHHFRLGFFGGEPLLCFDKIARPIIKYVSAKCRDKGVSFSVHFTSNGYLLTEVLVDYLSQFACSFQITLDGHRALHDKTRTPADGSGSYDRIMANIRCLLSHGITVIARVNYTPDNLPTVPDIIRDFASISESDKRFLRMDLQKVWQTDIPWRDCTVAIKKIEDMALQNGIFCRSTYLLNYVYDSCYGSSRHHILINYNGDAYCCTARDFSRENRVGYIDEAGQIVFDHPGYMDCRMKARFNRPSCRKCRIAPLCSGGCRQKGMETLDKGDYCMYSHDDEIKDYFVMARFERLIIEPIQENNGTL